MPEIITLINELLTNSDAGNITNVFHSIDNIYSHLHANLNNSKLKGADLITAYLCAVDKTQLTLTEQKLRKLLLISASLEKFVPDLLFSKQVQLNRVTRCLCYLANMPELDVNIKELNKTTTNILMKYYSYCIVTIIQSPTDDKRKNVLIAIKYHIEQLLLEKNILLNMFTNQDHTETIGFLNTFIALNPGEQSDLMLCQQLQNLYQNITLTNSKNLIAFILYNFPFVAVNYFKELNKFYLKFSDINTDTIARITNIQQELKPNINSKAHEIIIDLIVSFSNISEKLSTASKAIEQVIDNINSDCDNCYFFIKKVILGKQLISLTQEYLQTCNLSQDKLALISSHKSTHILFHWPSLKNPLEVYLTKIKAIAKFEITPSDLTIINNKNALLACVEEQSNNSEVSEEISPKTMLLGSKV